MCATDKRFLGISILRWGQIFVGGSIAFAAWSVSYANVVRTGKDNSQSIATHILKSEIKTAKQDETIRSLEHKLVAISTDIKWIRENLNDGKFYKKSNRN